MNAHRDTERLVAGLFDLVQAPIRWQLVKAAFELGVFDALTDEVTAEQAGLACDLQAGDRMPLFLDALSAMGLVTKQRGRYRLSEGMAPYLLSQGTHALREVLLHLATLRHADAGALLRSPPAQQALDMADAGFWDRAAANLHAFHQSLVADAMLAILRDLPQWPACRSLLDLGGGSAVLAAGVLADRSDMQATVLDLPPVVARMRQTLEALPVTQRERLSLLAGDYNDSDLAGPYDIIWASMTLYYARDLTDVLGRVRAALAPGGAFVSLHEGLQAERTQPEAHVVGRIVPALRGQDLSFNRGDIAAALRQVGFTRVDSREIDLPFGPMCIDIAV